MAVSKAQQKAVNKYMRENYDRIAITTPKGQKEIIQAHAAAHSESVNGFINRAIVNQMERDGADGPQQAAGAPAVAGGISGISPPDAQESTQRAAERTGEAVAEFLTRAAQAQAKRDELSLRMGLNPATGEKLKGEA